MRYLKLARNFSSLSNGFMITTPIYYATACKSTSSLYIESSVTLNHLILAPHLGHLYSSVIADTINRFQKLTNLHHTHVFSTGTDEHGIKVLEAATKQNIPVGAYCDGISNEYRNLFQASNVEFSDFIRTTEERHKEGVGHLWRVLRSQGDIYKDKYSGWYCVPDETFVMESQLKIENGQKLSIESGHPVEWTEEENYMFKLSEYQDEVRYWAKAE